MAAIGTTTYRRRSKAAIFLICCSWGGVFPHYLHGFRSFIPTIFLALFLGGYSFYAITSKVWRSPILPSSSLREYTLNQSLPSVDLIVAARDEESVILKLVNKLTSIHYPKELLHIWIIDDGSEDHTPQLLINLQKDFPNLRVIHRARGSGGGKSGALNTIFSQLKSDWCMILDADAELQFDVLERLIPFAEEGGWSAVQLRKAINNASENFLTRAQAMEMVLDAAIQQGRLSIGGIVELRGNGQLFRREVIELCGGFNEATVTDDLDLTFRFLLAKQPIGILWDPPVQEEGVLTFIALWRQRQRWAEGGLQRFFDYSEGLVSSRLDLLQKCDLIIFFLIQYVLPIISLADLITSIVTQTVPVYWPLSMVTLTLSTVVIARSCKQLSEGPPIPAVNILNLALEIIYLAHWLVVIPWVTLRMALLRRNPVWVKTLHHGVNPISCNSLNPNK